MDNLTKDEIEKDMRIYHSNDLPDYLSRMNDKIFEIFKKEIQEWGKAYTTLDSKLYHFFNSIEENDKK